MESFKTRQELEHKVITLARQGLARRAIARATGVSRNTVRKILVRHARSRSQPQTQLARVPPPAPRPRKLDAHAAEVAALLVRFPEITAQRVFEELRSSGYAGGYSQVKEHVRRIRPRTPEPSRVTPVYGPGEMAESDWSPYTIDFTTGKRETLQVFNYVLCFSRRKSYLAFTRCDLHALMDGHVATFERFGGAATQCKYDSQKAVVLGWEGQQPIYNPRFLAFATYYEFRPQACRIRHPNDKPKTERSFWELERSFLNGRRFRDVDDFRAQLADWLDTTCDVRPHKKLKRTAIDMFADERQHLRPLPVHPYDTARILYRLCSIDGFVSHDGNRYAVPYDHITDILPIRVTQHELFVYAADLRLVAKHELALRGAGLDVDPAGIHPPWNRRGADLDQLDKTFRDMGEHASLFFAGLRTAQSRFAGYHARQILLLRERYATYDLEAALRHAHSFGAFESRAIERILAARAKPRSLAQYVTEEIARKLDEPIAGDTHLRDLDEYDQLPVAPPPKEPSPCPNESHPLDRQDPKSSSSDSDDTSNISD